jgi:hypothetical protein
MVLRQNNNKLSEFNDRRRKYLKKYPEDAEYIKIIDSINDVFTPYDHWLDGMTGKDKTELKIIPDGYYNFSGIYICRDHNDHYHIEELTDYCVKDSLFDYGVVDNATQIIENCNIPENAVVLMVPVLKECQPHTGGWRWHKWGPYYGVQNPKNEYIYDEKDIEMIYCFSVILLEET